MLRLCISPRTVAPEGEARRLIADKILMVFMKGLAMITPRIFEKEPV
jgi:hypothetical protein